jgi:hypothetical protein
MQPTFSQSRETILESSIEALKQTLQNALVTAERWGVESDVALKPTEGGLMSIIVTFRHNKEVASFTVDPPSIMHYAHDVTTLAQDLADRLYFTLIRPNILESLNRLPLAMQNAVRVNSGARAL